MPDADPFPAETPGLPGEALDALLDGNLLAAGAAARPEFAPRLQEVAELLAALNAAPAADELAGHDQALTAFRRMRQATAPPHSSPDDATAQAGASTRAGGRPAWPAHRRRRHPAALLAIRAAAAGAVTALGALAAAAYLGVLPAPIQRLAHDAIGAPVPATSQPWRPQPAPPRQASPSTLTSSPSPSPVTVPSSASLPSRRAGGGSSPARAASPPPATAPAQAAPPGTAGQCNAYEHASPSARKHSAAFKRLIAAAGGQDKVPAYCAKMTGSPSP
ncbi:MAG: hypothetical protein ACM32E_32685 [Gemmatimonadota bacterium]